MRITKDEVKAELDSDLGEDSLRRAVEAANSLTDEVSSRGSVSDTTLENIEFYLACHLASAGEPLLERESVGDVSAEVQGEFGQGLAGTKYGQNAQNLDPTGYLQSLDEDRTEFSLESISF